MPRSKLEMHVDILRALARCGPLKPTQISCETNTDYRFVKQCVSFLIQYNLVGEGKLHNGRRKTSVVYTIEEEGLTALKYFRQLNSVLQLHACRTE